MFQYVVERQVNGVTQHIIANNIHDVQVILSKVSKEEIGGTFPLYSIEDLIENKEEKDEIEE